MLGDDCEMTIVTLEGEIPFPVDLNNVLHIRLYTNKARREYLNIEVTKGLNGKVGIGIRSSGWLEVIPGASNLLSCFHAR